MMDRIQIGDDSLGVRCWAYVGNSHTYAFVVEAVTFPGMEFSFTGVLLKLETFSPIPGTDLGLLMASTMVDKRDDGAEKV